MTIQDALSITYKNASDKDKLAVVYGSMLSNIVANWDFADLVNRNYSGDNASLVRGGTINVKRMKYASAKTYGTARTNGYGDKLQNNGVDVKINIDKEIVEEIENKDLKLYTSQGAAMLLANRSESHQTSMMVDLDEAYFVALQTAATTFDTSPFSGATALDTIIAKFEAIVRKLEAVNNDNVKGVPRSMIVATLAPEFYDAIEKYTQTLPNPLNGGVEARYFRRVEVRPALRQDVDIVVQARGSMAMPLTVDNYSVNKIPLSNAYADELYYSYGLEAVQPDTIFKGSLSADNNISI